MPSCSSSSTKGSYGLTGPSRRLDPRVHAYRGDLADVALAGPIIAPHYARPLPRACGMRAAFVRSEGDSGATALTELLPGEGFHVLEYTSGWAWGYSASDHLVGYVEAIELVEPAAATHIVCEKSAPVSADCSIVAPVLAHLPMGSRLTGEERGANLLSDVGCVPLSYLRRTGECEEDSVCVAERLIGTLYLQGGRTLQGIDGPGLVQLSLGLCGTPTPRLPEQLAELGEPVTDGGGLKRGDLIVFDDHAGLMIDDLMLVHACRDNGRVLAEPLAIVEERLGKPQARRRNVT